MNKYELVCILDPQVGENDFDEVVERYENYLTSNGAEMAHIDRWGMRQLAYTSPGLKKRRQGYYVLYQFTAEPTLISPLEQDLKLDEGVLRYLVVSVQGEFLRVPQLASETLLAERHARRERGRPGRPGSDRPGSGRPGADRPGSGRPGADRPGADRPGADRPGADRPEDKEVDEGKAEQAPEADSAEAAAQPVVEGAKEEAEG